MGWFCTALMCCVVHKSHCYSKLIIDTLCHSKRAALYNKRLNINNFVLCYKSVFMNSYREKYERKYIVIYDAYVLTNIFLTKIFQSVKCLAFSQLKMVLVLTVHTVNSYPRLLGSLAWHSVLSWLKTVGKTSSTNCFCPYSSCNLYFFVNASNLHTLKQKACRGGPISCWFLHYKSRATICKHVRQWGCIDAQRYVGCFRRYLWAKEGW